MASPILVSSASGLFADQVAEQTMALLLALLRKLPVFFRAQQRREFIRRPTEDLRGKTVGIVGFGGNGRRIAEVLAPWKVRIVATDMFPVDRPAHVAELWPAERLEDLLEIAEVVILCVPLNARTEGLIDAAALRRLRPGALLVNVARGPVVVERDLVEALQAGRLAGAGLDVTEVEPLPPESPLWDLPQAILTPHVGAQSARRADDTTGLVCENLRRYLAGQPPWNLVDKGLGFPRPEHRAP
jgi:D-3-phosphoglycerate dehydrogenase